MRRVMRLIVALGLIPAGLAAQDLKAFVLIPPQKVLTGVKKIAMLDFDTRRRGRSDSPDAPDDSHRATRGGDLAQAVISQLIQENRGMHEVVETHFLSSERHAGRTLQAGSITNVFDIIERSRLDQVISEQKLGASGLLDETQAAAVGKILGVQAVVIGTLVLSPTEAPSQESRTVEGADHVRRTTKVDCIERRMTAQATFRILNTQTAQVMGSSTARAGSQSKRCQPEMDRLMTHEQLIEALTAELAGSIANYISPRFELQKFDLKNIHGTHDQEQLAERAEHMAHDLNIDGAYVIYKGMYDKDSYNPDLLHDLAVMNEVVGNFAQSLELYQSRCQLKSDGDCRDAVERVQQSLAFRQALKQFGMEFPEHVFETSSAVLEQATLSQLEIKGGNDERFSVFAEAREGSAVVAAVPGGITLSIIKKEGDWYLVKLLGGKQGYIQATRVKLK